MIFRKERFNFIKEVHESGLPQGTTCTIGKNTNGTIITSTGATTLKVTNHVPNTSSIVIKKTDSDSEPLPGAKFELDISKGGEWIPKYEDIDLSNVTEFEITGLADGRYRLIETQAPTNYAKIRKEIHFRKG